MDVLKSQLAPWRLSDVTNDATSPTSNCDCRSLKQWHSCGGSPSLLLGLCRRLVHPNEQESEASLQLSRAGPPLCGLQHCISHMFCVSFHTCSLQSYYVGLWRDYINVAITILDIIHRSIFYLKHGATETGSCLRLQVEPTQFGPIHGASLSPDTSSNTNMVCKTKATQHKRTLLVLLLVFRHRPTVAPNWVDFTWRLRKYPVSERLCLKWKAGRWIMSRIVLCKIVFTFINFSSILFSFLSFFFLEDVRCNALEIWEGPHITRTCTVYRTWRLKCSRCVTFQLYEVDC
jgi:hypothetical protein